MGCTFNMKKPWLTLCHLIAKQCKFAGRRNSRGEADLITVRGLVFLSPGAVLQLVCKAVVCSVSSEGGEAHWSTRPMLSTLPRWSRSRARAWTRWRGSSPTRWATAPAPPVMIKFLINFNENFKNQGEGGMDEVGRRGMQFHYLR